MTDMFECCQLAENILKPTVPVPKPESKPQKKNHSIEVFNAVGKCIYNNEIW